MCLAHNIGKTLSKVQAMAEQERACYQPMMAMVGQNGKVMCFTPNLFKYSG